MTAPLRLVFAGSPAAAVPSLIALADSEHEVVAVVTREDSPVGRKRVLTPTPVAQEAEERGIPVLKANRISAIESELLALFAGPGAADLGVIVAYGGLIREPILSAPRLGWINLHFSLLPKWRGAAPVQRAVMAGETETGTAVFQLVEELDAGPVFDMEAHPIDRSQTAGELLETLATTGAAQLARVVGALGAGTAVATPQTGEPTLAPKLSLADGRLDWTRSAAELDAQLRGVTPEPGAFTQYAGERMKIHAAEIAAGAPALEPGELALVGRDVHVGTRTDPLRLITVQPAGKTAMPADAWWRGRRSDAPTSFSSESSGA